MRYMVHAPTKGVPPLGSVMTPTLTRTYAGWSSRGQIEGHPGTKVVPAPKPGGLWRGINDLANVGVSVSSSSPDMILPSLYYLTGKQEKFPASVVSDNQMPVPAIRPANIIPANPYRSRKGGQRQVAQPQVVQTWRTMKGTTP